ncbi:MAG: hypothetical protein RMJ82_06665 [Gemmatales bacterium]|nr:hypothetical protein [Gemmatales bacterium]
MESQPPVGVLFVAYEASQIELFLTIGRALRLSGNVVPVIYCPYALPREKDYRQFCTEAGIEYLQEHTAQGARVILDGDIHTLAVRYSEPLTLIQPVVRPENYEWVRNLSGYADYREALKLRPRLVKNRARTIQILEEWRTRLPTDLFFQAISDFRFWLEAYDVKLRTARALVKKMRISTIILAEHVAERDSGVWLRVALETGLVAIVLAQHMISRQATFGTYASRSDYWAHNIVNSVFLEHFPQWRFDGDKQSLMRIPAPQALAQEWWGIAMSSPWVANSEPLTGVWVESSWLADQYLREGINAKSLSITGSPQLDRLARALAPPIYGEKSDVWERLRLDRSKPLVVVALPANLYPQRKAPKWDTYEELLYSYIQELKRLNHVSYICSLHPSISDSTIAALEAWRVPFIREGLTEVLPSAQIYLASTSSTIAWALACGIPVINFDVYQLNYQIAESEHGVHTIQTLEELREVLEEIDHPRSRQNHTPRSDYLSKLREKARRHASYYGQLDGRCLERTIAGIYELIRRRLPAPSVGVSSNEEARELDHVLQTIKGMSPGKKVTHVFSLRGIEKGYRDAMTLSRQHIPALLCADA